ncbi:DUF5959 family protein [Streptomyces ardesiacus]|nr:MULTISPECIES: DUF5959 family protein [Streptomyces]
MAAVDVSVGSEDDRGQRRGFDSPGWRGEVSTGSSAGPAHAWSAVPACLDAEIVVVGRFAQGRLEVCLAPDDLDCWSEVPGRRRLLRVFESKACSCTVNNAPDLQKAAGSRHIGVQSAAHCSQVQDPPRHRHPGRPALRRFRDRRRRSAGRRRSAAR